MRPTMPHPYGKGIGMRRQGRIVEWNDARGFGFILWHGGNERAFAHIRDFTDRKLRPAVGDVVTYDQTMEQGRPRATAIAYAAAPVHPEAQVRSVAAQGDRRAALAGWITAALLVAIVAGVAWHYRIEHQRRLADERAHHAAAASRTGATPRSSPGVYRCEGKQHCSQMASCEEARFYVAHCPDTRMDGDGDGKPCEDWCR